MGRIPGLKLNRAGIALLGAISMAVFGGVTTADAVSYVNWPTIFLLFGFFVISAQLRLSGFYDKVAGVIAGRLGHPARFLFMLMVVTGGLSHFSTTTSFALSLHPLSVLRFCANKSIRFRF
jgi:Na+/H+ antiporter NhaD/arsenite permease-like protein